MHFKNQRALTVRRNGNVPKIKAFASVEGLTHRGQRRQRHLPDTDSRLSTGEPHFEIRVWSPTGKMPCPIFVSRHFTRLF
jgi:hypothetical protein